MRRTLLAIVAVALAFGLAVLAIASEGPAPRAASSGAPTASSRTAHAPPDSGPFAVAAERERSVGGEGYFEAAAARHRAVRAVRHTERASTRRGSRAAARVKEQVVRDLADRLDVEEDRMRSALASVGRDTLSLPGVRDRTTWSDRKREAITALARRLGRPVGEVTSAMRNELEAKLGLGVTFGVVTARGRKLALRCFDAPRTCPVGQLRDETRLHRLGGR
jgi:S1-C subfamily serine protease